MGTTYELIKEKERAIKDDKMLFLDKVEDILAIGNGIYHTLNCIIFIGEIGRKYIKEFIEHLTPISKIETFYVTAISISNIIDSFVFSSDEYVVLTFREDLGKYLLFNTEISSSLTYLREEDGSRGKKLSVFNELYTEINLHFIPRNHSNKDYYQVRTLWEKDKRYSKE